MEKAFLLFIITLITGTLNIKADAQTTTISANSQKATSVKSMAAEGEKVWVIINHIKSDKRQQFEQFVHEVFWPLENKLSTDEQRLFRQTRVLHPLKAEEDGSYSYMFIMDPYIEGGNYDIERLLKKMYGERKAAEYYKLFSESQFRDQSQYMVVQSRN